MVPAADPATAERAELAERLAACCRQHRPGAERVHVSDLQRIFGGGSRETWRFTLTETRTGRDEVHALVLRRDPATSLIDTQRRVEVAALRAFEGSDVPVPRIGWLEEDPQPLGHPYFVMEAITGCEAGPMKLMAPPYMAHHAAIARQAWTLLGHIARTDPAPLAGLVPAVTPATAWQHELDHWAGVIDQQAQAPQPIAQAAIRWLRAHPPPPAQRLSVVHGDYRVGNLLVAPDGTLRAVLDWEMAHAGDPLEDLAWSFNRMWCFQRNHLVGGMATRAEAIAWWQATSGLQVDPRALHWWELFNAVKGQGIWLGAARAFADGGRQDLLLAYAAWALMNSQDRAMLELMGQLNAHPTEPAA